MVEIWVNADKGTDTGTGTKEKPLKSPDMAIKLLSGGSDKLVLAGTFHGGLRLAGLVFSNELLVDGQGATLFYGFEGEPETFSPLAMPKRTWGNLTISDCHNVRVKNLEVWGGIGQCISLDDSYPEIGLKNVALEWVTCRYGAPRGIFMGGHNIDGVTIDECRVDQCCYGDTTHGIYLTGGHWRGDYPPVRNVKVSNTSVSFSGGRHGMQLNGRFDGVEINRFTAKHNQLGGLSLIGVQNCTVKNSVFYGNHRGLVLYDYFDYDYYDPANPEAFKAYHHGMQNILVSRCTIVVGPTQWMHDQWHNNNPYQQAGILVNSNLGGMEGYEEFKPENINIEENVIWTPSERTFQMMNNYDAKGTFTRKNLCWGKAAMPVAYIGSNHFDITALNKTSTGHFKDNIVADPEFNELPTYANIDLTQGPYDFSNFPSSADLYSKNAAMLNVGAFPHKKIFVAGKGDISVHEG